MPLVWRHRLSVIAHMHSVVSNNIWTHFLYLCQMKKCYLMNISIFRICPSYLSRPVLSMFLCFCAPHHSTCTWKTWSRRRLQNSWGNYRLPNPCFSRRPVYCLMGCYSDCTEREGSFMFAFGKCGCTTLFYFQVNERSIGRKLYVRSLAHTAKNEFLS